MGPVSPFVAALSAPARGTGTYTGVSTTPAFEISYARSLARYRKLIVEVELPVNFGPAKDVKSSASLAAKDYKAVFFTPSMRLVFASAVRGESAQEKPRSSYLAAYPFISIGGGFAHFCPNAFTSTGASSGATSTTKGAFQIGGGVDFLPFKRAIGFRIEARDFYSGSPDLGVPGVTYHNNVVAGGGVVVWFGGKK